MEEPAVPVVDIAAFLADPSSDAAASVAAAWDAAFREYGIVYLTGHGVPDVVARARPHGVEVRARVRGE